MLSQLPHLISLSLSSICLSLPYAYVDLRAATSNTGCNYCIFSWPERVADLGLARIPTSPKWGEALFLSFLLACSLPVSPTAGATTFQMGFCWAAALVWMRTDALIGSYRLAGLSLSCHSSIPYSTPKLVSDTEVDGEREEKSKGGIDAPEKYSGNKGWRRPKGDVVLHFQLIPIKTPIGMGTRQSLGPHLPLMFYSSYFFFLFLPLPLIHTILLVVGGPPPSSLSFHARPRTPFSLS